MPIVRLVVADIEAQEHAGDDTRAPFVPGTLESGQLADAAIGGGTAPDLTGRSQEAEDLPVEVRRAFPHRVMGGAADDHET